ncbi:D-alanyl-D-alanine carboxypeptidase family protein [Ruminococcus flavefaciens]|uniref:D-alanyl-D-alanine carboxypeptidase n=1 Tax=Ruminococcus flavefaciens TaxID=1265 RepID=A0A1M7H352_RUMFL|nr:D-alanyl-D-alanine carboxypeptidase family protein [Ruminococcus flavefaciens]SHM22833.1 D-alanyl-D-alanine carboxypeptidase [Ruminococcus flavefaciens]
MSETKKCRLRVGRVFLAMVLTAGTLFGADTIRRSLESHQPYNLTIHGDFRNSEDNAEPLTGNSLSYGTTDEATTAFEGIKYLGYSEFELSKDDISKGILSVYTDKAPASVSDQGHMVDLAEEKNEFYSIVDEKSYLLNKDAAGALNRMMEDYANEIGLADFMVYGTTDTFTGEDSLCPKKFSESKAGYCVDLALNAYGNVLEYDGCDAEGWVVENCWKYGFVVRYPEGKKEKTGNEYCPWHLRYVGEVHAAIMSSKKMCLEEYVDYLEQYTFEEPYSFTFNSESYQIYSVSGNDDRLETRVPISGNYELSGDNRNSFIIMQKN